MIDIWEPRWHDRKVLIAKYKVRDGPNEIRFTKAPTLKGMTFVLSGAAIRKCPLETNGKIACYAVPLDEFEELSNGKKYDNTIGRHRCR